jgi:acetoin utilization deacetylase AcuC-like enzyme
LSLPIYTHLDMARHHPGPGHAERPERLAAVLDALDDSDLDLERAEAPLAARSAASRLPGDMKVSGSSAARPCAGASVKMESM